MALPSPEIQEAAEREAKRQQIADYMAALRVVMGVSYHSEEEKKVILEKGSKAGEAIFATNYPQEAVLMTPEVRARFGKNGEVGPLTTRVMLGSLERGFNYAHFVLPKGGSGDVKKDEEIIANTIAAKTVLFGGPNKWLKI